MRQSAVSLMEAFCRNALPKMPRKVAIRVPKRGRVADAWNTLSMRQWNVFKDSFPRWRICFCMGENGAKIEFSPVRNPVRNPKRR